MKQKIFDALVGLVVIGVLASAVWGVYSWSQQSKPVIKGILSAQVNGDRFHRALQTYDAELMVESWSLDAQPLLRNLGAVSESLKAMQAAGVKMVKAEEIKVVELGEKYVGFYVIEVTDGKEVKMEWEVLVFDKDGKVLEVH